MNADTPPPLTIGQYLLDCLDAYGVKHIFGIPGDYVLRFNKLIEQHPNIQFINTTRESTAGCAADTYARLRGLGVACITYGVGMSITNALAQAYVESSPLVVISGALGIGEFKKNKAWHHLINTSMTVDGDCTQLEVFKNMTIDQGVLKSPHTAAAIIDRVLHACLKHKKPVYLEIPRDQVDQPLPFIPSSFLSKTTTDSNALHEALIETQTILSQCHHPIIWAGHEILRFGLSDDILQFAEKHQIPIVSSLLGKTVIDEYHPLFIGVYQGEMSLTEVSEAVHQCDCLLMAGVVMNDLNTGIFTAKLDQANRIVTEQELLTINHHHYKIHLVDYIKGLNTLHLPQIQRSPLIHRQAYLHKKFEAKAEAKTTIKRVFQCLQSYLTSEHIIVSDVGDSLFSSSDLTLSQNSFLSCSYFASLGFSTPAAIGAQFAEPERRVIAITGDGGFQMTAMELSTAIRYHLDPIVIVLNNHGYGTERILLEGTYNDLVNWNYTKITQVLGGGIGIKAETEGAFEEALKQALANRSVFYIIEVELDKLDFSPALHRLGELLGKAVRSIT